MYVGNASSEFSAAHFNDRRLTRRLGDIADQLAEAPDRGMPAVLENEAALEAFYRFVNNERVEPLKILEPHFENTRMRALKHPRILVIHDTTRVHFADRGFGPLLGDRGGEGFFLHLALAVRDARHREPLGVLSAGTFEREARRPGRRKTKEERAANNELSAWKLLYADVMERLAGHPVVHVMDRQADCYDLLVGMRDSHFVVRIAHDRKVSTEDGTSLLRDALKTSTAMLTREVVLSPRADSGGRSKSHLPARDMRNAALVASASAVRLQRPPAADPTAPEELSLNVIQVLERDPPPGEAPVEWLLYTTLPISTAAEIEAAIDIYRTRWVIEEYFKSLKTGCALESRQLESREGLLNMLAISIPIAWRLLLLRHLARHAPEEPATATLRQSQLDVLARTPRAKLPENPTNRDALLAVARLGGHLKRNGDPGWLVLTRGYTKLLTLEEGWLAARGEDAPRCDQ